MFAFDTPIVTGTDTFDTQKDGAALDLLNRKAFAQRLSDLMGRGDQPLVVALDGGWGAGKSHFLKLWTGSHKGFGGTARVVYFDAFETHNLGPAGLPSAPPTKRRASFSYHEIQ